MPATGLPRRAQAITWAATWPAWTSTAPYLDSARDMLTDRITRGVASIPTYRSCSTREVAELEGFVGNFTPAEIGDRLNGGGVRGARSTSATSWSRTGYKEFDASRITHYGYGKLPNVITSFEFEQMLRAGRIETKEGQPPQYVAIIHCVGSRAARSSTATARASAA